jgi:hypothetical protein
VTVHLFNQSIQTRYSEWLADVARHANLVHCHRIWVYSPPVGNGTSGRVVPVEFGAKQYGLAVAKMRLEGLPNVSGQAGKNWHSKVASAVVGCLALVACADVDQPSNRTEYSSEGSTSYSPGFVNNSNPSINDLKKQLSGMGCNIQNLRYYEGIGGRINNYIFHGIRFVSDDYSVKFNLDYNYFKQKNKIYFDEKWDQVALGSSAYPVRVSGWLMDDECFGRLGKKFFLTNYEWIEE